MADERKLVKYARALRKNMTDAERKLWRSLRRKSMGYKFRRQAPLGPYIADFVCFERRLVIEVDGGQHLDNPKDRVRDFWMREQGFKVLRFWNSDVLKNLDGVLETIQRELDREPSPLTGKGRGEGENFPSMGEDEGGGEVCQH
ncbi:MAG: endonuclease domain-containing protein [bacterium]